MSTAPSPPAVFRKGELLYESTLSSAGEGERLLLTHDTHTLRADGQDMAFVYITLADKEGKQKAYPEKTLRVRVEGAGKLAGFGSASYKSEHGFSEGVYETCGGRALAVVRSTHEVGKITLTVESDECSEDITLEAVK